MPEGSTTWSQLSGGIDSSSIVGMAQWLAKSGTVSQGLAGTVTWADSHGMGADERGYSDAVAEHAHVRNETIVDVGLWADDGQPPPLTDQPEGTFSLYARQRKMCEIVTGAGGRVLLTGLGGDELFVGSMFFFADWLVAGRRWEAIREMAVRAAMGRVSFWSSATMNAILPLLPALLQRRLVRGEGQLPPWATERAVRSYDLRRRAFAPFVYAGRRGKKYEDAIAAAVTACRVTGAGGVIEDQLDVRHPYLDRPLVEFALTLPPETCVRPFQRKWILREAMKGILPDLVRCRIGKGLLAGAHAASITRDRSVIEPLLRDPILANLGVVSARNSGTPSRRPNMRARACSVGLPISNTPLRSKLGSKSEQASGLVRRCSLGNAQSLEQSCSTTRRSYEKDLHSTCSDRERDHGGPDHGAAVAAWPTGESASAHSPAASDSICSTLSAVQ